MSVAGLSNLGFSQAAKNAPSAKSSSGKGEKPSFENVLGQIRNKAKAEAEASSGQGPRIEERQEQKSQPQSNGFSGQQKNKEQTQSETAKATSVADTRAPNQGVEEVEASSAENSSGLPTPSSAPSLNGPGMADRSVGTPINATAVNPIVNKPAIGITKEDPANSLTRRVVWNDFLRKMNDLGISADDVLTAFGSLSEKDLAQPPEQSVDKIVMALGLDGQQAALAKQYFSELISKTKSKSLGEEVAASHQQLSLSMMSQRDFERKTLSNSLDKMNNNFFMHRPLAEKNGELNPMAQQPGEEMQNRQAVATTAGPEVASGREWASREGASVLPLAPISIPGLAAPAPQAAAAAPAALHAGSAQSSEINDLIDQMREIPPGDKKSMAELIKNFNARQETNFAPAAAAAPTPGVTTTVAVPAAAPSAAVSALNGIFAGAGGKKSQQDFSEDSGQDSGGSAIDPALVAENRMGAAHQAKGDFQSQMTKATQHPQVMTVPELVQQAQVIIKDGGGEMKVTMHPEGLGEVAMRVSVEGGKVSVQMITESDEAKKMIERQIGDLKHSLSSNHLQVDSIKIDTATNLGKQLEQQYDEAARQQAQQSMEQFRQDHQGWRRSFFETGSASPYMTQSEAPRDVKAPTASNKKAGARRLDLVA